MNTITININKLPHDIMILISSYLDCINYSNFGKFRYFGKILKTDTRYEIIKNIPKPFVIPYTFYPMSHTFCYLIKLDYKNRKGTKLYYFYDPINKKTILEVAPCVVNQIRGTWKPNYDRKLKRYSIDEFGNVQPIEKVSKSSTLSSSEL